MFYSEGTLNRMDYDLDIDSIYNILNNQNTNIII